MGYWTYRQKTLLARAAGLSASYLSDVLHRRKGVSWARAKVLEESSRDILGYEIPARAWMENRTTHHPAFCGSVDNS